MAKIAEIFRRETLANSNNFPRSTTKTGRQLPPPWLRLCFLGIFEELTKVAEGQKQVTLYRVWPVLRELRAHLYPNKADSDLIAAMKHVGLEFISK